MADFASLRKTDLIKLITEINAENKVLKGKFKEIKSGNKKPFKALSILRIDGIPCAVTVQFNVEDILESKSELMEEFKAYKDPHMAEFKARRLLAHDITSLEQTHEGELE